MWPILAGFAGAAVTAAAALYIDSRRHKSEREHDMWAAIGGLRQDVAENSEHLAEIRGLLSGLYAEILGDPAIVNRVPAPVVRKPRHTREP